MLFFTDLDLFPKMKLTLSQSQRNHLRARRFDLSGTSISCSNGKNIGHGTLYIEKKEYIVLIESVSLLESNTESPLTLYCSIIKPDRMSWLVEKCTEIGVGTIAFVLTDRTQHHYWSTKSFAHYYQVMIAACTQSQRYRPMTLMPSPFHSLGEALAHAQLQRDRILFAGYEPQHQSDSYTHCPDVFNDEKKSSLFIGPEGGWSDQEIDLLKKIVHPCTYKHGLLRSETAAIVLASSLLSRYPKKEL
jgi:16S rRNA (uracil1498-N3)-methyltransferase